jgi:hypothetical protein
MAGHNGIPNQPLKNGNHVRLLDAKTHEILAESRPPRNDSARRYEWNLAEHSGKQGDVELTDSDTANAYAWLAVGRFHWRQLSDTPRFAACGGDYRKLKLASERNWRFTSRSATDGAARAARPALVASNPIAGRRRSSRC